MGSVSHLPTHEVRQYGVRVFPRASGGIPWVGKAYVVPCRNAADAEVSETTLRAADIEGEVVYRYPSWDGWVIGGE